MELFVPCTAIMMDMSLAWELFLFSPIRHPRE